MASRAASAAIVAYEADVVHGSAADISLIPWAGADGVWIDRFDALHLIASPPRYAEETDSEWSSAEDDDAFFLSGDELVVHEQAKRREQLASLRTERIRTKTIKESAAPLVHPQPAVAMPEEPPPAILQLMQHTAKALRSSPDRAMLEMRIMTNHAGDSRFAFLRGRWPDAWARVKGLQAVPAQREDVDVPRNKPTLDLGYASSEQSSEEEFRSPPPPPPGGELPPPDVSDVQRQRRQRAREWAAKRKREVVELVNNA